MTMTLVSTVTVGAGGAASIDFTSIPQTGTDLLLVVSARVSGASAYSNISIRFNSDSGANYNRRQLRGSGSAVASFNATGETHGLISFVSAASGTSDTFHNSATYIPNYSSSNTKSFSSDGVQENNTTEAYQNLYASLWNSSSAITSINVLNSGGATLLQYSTASLYTITKGSGGATVS